MATLRNQFVRLGSMLALAALLAMAWLSYADQAACRDAGSVELQAGNPDGKNLTTPVQLQQPSPPQDLAIMKALDSTLKIKFPETPLKEVLDFLEAKTKGDLTFVFDEAVLKEAGIDVKQLQNDSVMNKDYKKMKVRAFLRMITSERKLAYYIDDGAIWITTKAQADKKRIVMAYPINNMIGVPAGTNILMMNQQFQQSVKNASDALIQQVTGMVEPEYWEASGGPGQMGFNPATCSILVKASLEVQYLLAASEALENRKVEAAPAVQEKAGTIVVKAYDIAGLIDPKNPERSKTEIESALNLVTGKDQLGPSSLVFLTHADLLIIRQPVEVQQQIERLLTVMRSARTPVRIMRARDERPVWTISATATALAWPCTGASMGLGHSSMMGGGMPMGGTPMGGMPMGGMPMSGMPMGGMPMGGMPMGGMPMGGGTGGVFGINGGGVFGNNGGGGVFGNGGGDGGSAPGSILGGGKDG